METDVSETPPTDGLEQAKAGCSFQVCVDASVPVEQLRRLVKERTGLDIHIKCRVGPIRIDGGKIDSPIEAVDDPFLNGKFNFGIPRPGTYLYIGYFKDPEKKE